MIKKAFFLTALIILYPLYVHADPMLYTFEGRIITAYANPGWNGPGSLPSEYTSLMLGQQISFAYLLDTANWHTTEVELASYSPNLTVNPNAGTFDSYIEIPGNPNFGYIQSISEYNHIRFGADGVSPFHPTDFDWQLGEVFAGYSYVNWTNFPDANPYGLEFRVTLASIAEVPEPAAISMFMMGILILFCWKRLRLPRN